MEHADKRAEIVAVDDEPEIRGLVAEYLGRHGYSVRTADGGAALRALLAKKPADLILLDVAMPGEDGFSVARQLRAQTQAAIIFVTAAHEVTDRVVGLEVGADDYLTKPFDLRELVARVRSVLRRTRSAAGQATTRMRFGRCVLDLDAHKLFDSEGREIRITRMEYDLLAAFARRPNRVLSRDQLLALAHQRESEAFDRSIDIRISRLRRKIEPDVTHPQVIKTVRGSGYVYVSLVES
jgi:two-component system phosphate regulon response regulator OmpR